MSCSARRQVVVAAPRSRATAVPAVLGHARDAPWHVTGSGFAALYSLELKALRRFIHLLLKIKALECEMEALKASGEDLLS